MTKAINPHAVIPKLFASWQQEDAPAQPTQLSMFFHLCKADIGQYCSLNKKLGRCHSSLLALQSLCSPHKPLYTNEGVRGELWAGLSLCCSSETEDWRWDFSLSFLPLSLSWMDEFWDFSAKLNNLSKALSLDRSLHLEQGKPNSGRRQTKFQWWDFFLILIWEPV